jgi:hypothetical protein
MSNTEQEQPFCNQCGARDVQLYQFWEFVTCASCMSATFVKYVNQLVDMLNEREEFYQTQVSELQGFYVQQLGEMAQQNTIRVEQLITAHKKATKQYIRVIKDYEGLCTAKVSPAGQEATTTTKRGRQVN